MTKETILKAAGLTLFAAVAVYTQYKPEKAQPPLETSGENIAVPEASQAAGIMSAAKAVSGTPDAVAFYNMATKEIVQVYSQREAVEAREPFELTEKDTPLELISTLITAPFNKAPGEAVSEGNNWRMLAYPPEYCDPPAYSKTFRRKGPGMQIDLYSYTVPSLTEAKELILSGELKIFEETGKDTARELLNIKNQEREPFKEIKRAEIMDLLKTSGFAVKPTEKHIHSPGGRNWTDVMELENGPVSGLMYFEPHGATRALRIRLEHKDMGAYSYRGPAIPQYSKPADFAAALISDLEKHGAQKVLGAAWLDAMNVLSASTAPVTLETLINARSAALQNAPDREAGAAFLLLENRLVTRILQMVTSKFLAAYPDSPPKELGLLDENGIGYVHREEAGFFAPTDNSIFKVYKAHPGAYWGQYAFTREMESGFSDIDSEDDLPVVMREGENFLSAHPDSPFLPRVLFLLAKAEETAYSVGLSPYKYDAFCTHSYCVELERDTEKHRMNAIKYYTRLLSLPGGKEYEEHLRHVLPKLRTKGSPYGAFFISCGGC